MFHTKITATMTHHEYFQVLRRIDGTFKDVSDADIRTILQNIVHISQCGSAVLQAMIAAEIHTEAAMTAFAARVENLPAEALEKGRELITHPVCRYFISREQSRRKQKADAHAARFGKQAKGQVLLPPSNVYSLFKVQTRLKAGVNKETGEAYDYNKGYLAQPVFSKDSEADRARWAKDSKKIEALFAELGHLAFKGYNGYDYTMRQVQRWEQAGNVQQARLYANQWRKEGQTSMGVMMLPVLVFEWNAPITHQ